MRLVLPQDTSWRGDSAGPDEALQAMLDRHAPGPDVRRYLAVFVPLHIFGRTLTEPLENLPIRTFTWMLQVSGYFGGRWVRAMILEAQPASPLGRGAAPVTRSWPETIDPHARTRREAAFGDDEAALSCCEGSLPELVSIYGYNLGFAADILASPPSGLRAPQRFLVPAGPLWCGYARPRLDALHALYDVRQKLLQSHDAEWNRLGNWIPAQQQLAIEQARRWRELGVNLEGIQPEDYDFILDAISALLEMSQAATLLAVRGAAESNVGAARRAALAASFLSSWRNAGTVGMADPRFDDAASSLPYFADVLPAP